MRYLCIFRKTPVGGSGARESFDLMLTLAAFDQEVTALLIDDGVFHLLPGQQCSEEGHPLPALWQSLEMYGIDSPWVERESLLARGMNQSCLSIPVRVVSRDFLPDFFAGFDRLIGD